jgi:hypothetical protein
MQGARRLANDLPYTPSDAPPPQRLVTSFWKQASFWPE